MEEGNVGIEEVKLQLLPVMRASCCSPGEQEKEALHHQNHS